MKEKVLNNKKNGMLVLILTTLLYLLSIAVCVVGAMIGNPLLLGISIFWMCVGWFPYCGLRVLKPQEALVLTLFGENLHFQDYWQALRKNPVWNRQERRFL